MRAYIEQKFKVNERNSTIKREIMSGIIAYLAMSYIVFVNPLILAQAGMNQDAVFAATIFASFVGTFLMGWYANYPLGIAPCMSMNAFFTYTVVLNMGLSWQEALACTLISSFLFVILSASKFRYTIIEAIPSDIKSAATVGLGLFIAFVGLKNAQIVQVVADSGQITFSTFENPNVVIAWIGIIISAIFMVKKSRFAILYGMIAAVVIGLLINLLNAQGILAINSDFVDSLPKIPDFDAASFSPLTPIKAMIDETMFVSFQNIGKIFTLSGFGVILSFLFLDFFGTAATLGAASVELKAAGLNDNNKRVYLADSVGTFFAATFGSSNVTTFIESVSGIVSGGRTGLSAVVTAFLFLFSIFLFPVLSLITAAVTTPAMVMIGVVMIRSVVDIDWHAGYEVTIPAFFVMILMPFLGSISLGLAIGFGLYGLLMLIAKRDQEINKMLWGIIIVSSIYLIATFMGVI
ncbi:MAG: NCS2 family permease [Mycoplasmatales bacterium]